MSKMETDLGTRLEWVECPLGKKSCTDCRFRGWVLSHENDPVLGCMIEAEFEGRIWSVEAWHPEHLTGPPSEKPLPWETFTPPLTALEHERTRFRLRFEFFVVEWNRLPVVVRAYDFEHHAVAHEPPAGRAIQGRISTSEIVALLLIGFAGARRRSELVALDVPDIQSRGDGLIETPVRLVRPQRQATQSITALSLPQRSARSSPATLR